MIGNVCLRPVGTRGGRGAGWGPCACPAGLTSGLGCVRPTGLLPTRTSTRPPHPPHSAPCPYRMQDALPRFGRHHSSGGWAASVPMGMITPFGWQNSVGLDLLVVRNCQVHLNHALKSYTYRSGSACPTRTFVVKTYQ